MALGAVLGMVLVTATGMTLGTMVGTTLGMALTTIMATITQPIGQTDLGITNTITTSIIIIEMTDITV